MMIRAVLTGDIIASTKTDLNYKKVIEEIATDIQKYDPTFKLDIYRGDTLQMLVNDAKDGLFILLAVKAGLRRYSRDKKMLSFRTLLDARLSLGIGQVDDGNTNDLGSMNGEAFTYSGRTLDKMKSEGAFIKITTGHKELDQEFAAVTPLLDAITQRWTTYQAEAIYLYLLKSATQAQIGKELNISQRGAGKRLEGGHIDNILQYNDYFKKRLAWKLNI